MSDTLSPSAWESNDLDFSNLFGDVGEDFDMFMAAQHLDIPSTTQNCLEVPIATKKDEDSARCDDVTTVYDGCNQNISGATNPTVASVIDPLLLSKYIRFRATQMYQAKMIISGRTFNCRLGMAIVSNTRTTTLASISRAHTTDANVVSSSSS